MANATLNGSASAAETSPIVTSRPRSDFVETEFIRGLTQRALSYIGAGYPVHFRGPSGSGKTTLALHVAHRLGRPLALLCGDDEFGTSDLVGGRSGYRRRKVVDNFVHSVLKTEEDVTQHWVDNRLTVACRDGLTLLYDEFSRSRAEANNVLLAVLEEKMLMLPTSRNGVQYLKVHPSFVAIFTSNPDEYVGVHGTQDALLDRMITINLSSFDRDTEIEITQAKSGVALGDAERIVDVVREWRTTSGHLGSTLRRSIMIAKVLARSGARAVTGDPIFEQTCTDVLAVDRRSDSNGHAEPGRRDAGTPIRRIEEQSRAAQAASLDGQRCTIERAAKLPPCTASESLGNAGPPRRPLAMQALPLLALVAIAALVIVIVAFRHEKSTTPTLAQFGSDSLSVAPGAAVHLCVDVRDAAVVEILPEGDRLPGTGKHCVTVRPAVGTTYVAVATGTTGEQVRGALTVKVVNAAKPQRLRIDAFSAMPSRIKAGQATRLCYAVTAADFLRIVPRIGDLSRPRSCRTITLRNPHRYTYSLFAIAARGQIAMRQVDVDVVASISRAALAKQDAHNANLARKAVYRFDAAPRIIERGKTTSLCVDIDRRAHGFVTHVGRLQPGIVRCYRLRPRTTTVFRLYVAFHHSRAVEAVTVSVRPRAHRHYLGRFDHL